LEHSADFFRVGFVPKGSIATAAEFLVPGDGLGIGINGGAVHGPMLLVLVDGMGNGAVGFADAGGAF
jgi:hypothetical protein